MDDNGSLEPPRQTVSASSSAAKTFADRFFEKSGNLADKWEQYLSVYQVELAPYLREGKPIRLLEIGVQNGGSLELWSEYLPPGSVIVGIDSDPKVNEVASLYPNISIIVQDATKSDELRPLLGNSTFDIIIDDGSHICADVIAAFEFFFDYLAPGGKFIIEDLHTSYYASHGGGFREARSSIEWLKSLIDALHADYIQTGADISEHDRSVLRRLNALIARVAFYDSVAVVEKLRTEKVRPYRRVCSGLETPVVRPEDWIFKAAPELLETMIFAHPAARRVEAVLVREIEQLRVAQASNASREQELLAEIESLRASMQPVDPTPQAVEDDTASICARVLAVVDE